VDSTDEDFAGFVRVRSPALLRRAYLLCGGDRTAAEDLLQDVLERLYPRWRKIKGDPDAYARAALANAAANRWRRRSRRVTEVPATTAVEPGVAGPEHRIADLDAAVRALAVLGPRTRAILVLRYFEDLSEADTAAVLGCRVGTVKSLAARGLARLRTILAGPEDKHEDRAAQETVGGRTR
jgi:RNA polymerase sigma-70 factor (sigma-E family)